MTDVRTPSDDPKGARPKIATAAVGTAPIVSQERLKQLLDYDADTGFFLWKATLKHGHRVEGVRAGGVKRCSSKPHRYLQIDGKGYLAARLAWLYEHGEWPKRIWHVNGDTLDDRMDNLMASKPVYRRAWLPGVYQICNRFQVTYRHKGKTIYVGMFGSFEEAKAALYKSRREHNAPSKFRKARWIYKVKLGWSVRFKHHRGGKLTHLGTFETIEAARAALTKARARKPKRKPRKQWWDDPGAMSP